MIDPKFKERIAESIMKSKAIIALYEDSPKKANMLQTIESIEKTFESIFELDIPCPPHILPKLEEALEEIDDMYNKKASN